MPRGKLQAHEKNVEQNQIPLVNLVCVLQYPVSSIYYYYSDLLVDFLEKGVLFSILGIIWFISCMSIHIFPTSVNLYLHTNLSNNLSISLFPSVALFICVCVFPYWSVNQWKYLFLCPYQSFVSNSSLFLSMFICFFIFLSAFCLPVCVAIHRDTQEWDKCHHIRNNHYTEDAYIKKWELYLFVLLKTNEWLFLIFQLNK